MAEKNPALRRRRTLNGLDSVAVLPKAELLRRPRYGSLAIVTGSVFPEPCGWEFRAQGSGVNLAARETGEHFCELIGQEITVQ